MEESKIYSFGNPDFSYIVKINGGEVSLNEEKGFVVIDRLWEKGDYIELSFPMDIKVIRADERVAEDRGKVSLQRGPIVYNFEDIDNDTFNVGSVILDTNSPMVSKWEEGLLGGVMVIRAKGWKKTTAGLKPIDITAIPNYARLNRGGRSVVWVAETENSAEFEDEWVSGNSFSTYSIGKNKDRVMINYTIIPYSISDGIVGITGSDIAPSNWNHFPISVRIQPNGLMDARNYDTFSSSNAVYYQANKAYKISIVADVNQKTYSVWVTDDLGTTTLLADNFRFRNDAPEINDLGKVCVRGGSGVSAGLFTVRGFTVTSDKVRISNVSVNDGVLSFKALCHKEGVYDIYSVGYDSSGRVIKVIKNTLSMNEGEEKEFFAQLGLCGGYKIFVWHNNTLTPAASPKDI